MHNHCLNLIREIVLFVIGTAIIAQLYQQQALLTVLIVLFSIIQLTVFRQKDDIYYFIVGLIIGPVIDIVAVGAGVWEYKVTYIWGIPLWLPIAFGTLVVMFKRVAQATICLKNQD